MTEGAQRISQFSGGYSAITIYKENPKSVHGQGWERYEAFRRPQKEDPHTLVKKREGDLVLRDLLFGFRERRA